MEFYLVVLFITMVLQSLYYWIIRKLEGKTIMLQKIKIAIPIIVCILSVFVIIYGFFVVSFPLLFAFMYSFVVVDNVISIIIEVRKFCKTKNENEF